ncbi:MAG: thioredoxin domain-containing protein [Gemmatimonadetes bacterium]|nr:thioredoxin domain-containing protein [Gemmatimonadota bacterium]
MSNRLAAEPSPYLRQHADNPVDWYPWGDEALGRARRENRPLLLSIGYSSCHWCHVMARESFEDPDVAALMNEAFVCVKVDREERPDVDQVYMKAVQAMTGQGGWPLTVFLTPGAKPYYGGTYFPPAPRRGMPSFRQVLQAAAQAWRERPDDVRRGAGEIISVLQRVVQDAGEGDGVGSDVEILDNAIRAMARQYDHTHGGFGDAPKFPQPVTLEILSRHHARTGEPSSLEMLAHTLRRMAAGGIHDHLGGGFHRYSVDARWLVPHFEKMLYDNALLARAYLDGWRLSGDDGLRVVAERTLDWLLEDMRAPEGGFYSARDADSEEEEGRFYLWKPAEVRAELPAEDARLFMRCYDVSDEGNHEGASILWLPHGLGALASAEGMTAEELEARLAAARTVLAEARSHRVPPLRDEKILTGWNGMALRALAEVGGALAGARYVGAAEEGAAFLLEAMRPDGRLLHTFRDGVARIPGFLEDHGALGNALISLYEATLNPRWLDEARWCVEEILARFWSPEAGVFHDTSADAESLFLRPRDPMDNATPSGSSLAAELLLRAGHLFGEARYEEVARRALAHERVAMTRFPTAFGRLLSTLDRSLAKPVEVAVVGPPADAGTRALVTAALAPFHRNRTVAGKPPGAEGPELPVLAGRDAVDTRPTAYVCHGFTCRAPTTDPAGITAELRRTERG